MPLPPGSADTAPPSPPGRLDSLDRDLSRRAAISWPHPRWFTLPLGALSLTANYGILWYGLSALPLADRASRGRWPRRSSSRCRSTAVEATGFAIKRWVARPAAAGRRSDPAAADPAAAQQVVPVVTRQHGDGRRRSPSAPCTRPRCRRWSCWRWSCASAASTSACTTSATCSAESAYGLVWGAGVDPPRAGAALKCPSSAHAAGGWRSSSRAALVLVIGSGGGRHLRRPRRLEAAAGAGLRVPRPPRATAPSRSSPPRRSHAPCTRAPRTPGARSARATFVNGVFQQYAYTPAHPGVHRRRGRPARALRQHHRRQAGRRRRNQLVIGAHYDSAAVGQGYLDNATGIGLLLEMAARLKTQPDALHARVRRLRRRGGRAARLALLRALHERRRDVRRTIGMIDLDAVAGGDAALRDEPLRRPGLAARRRAQRRQRTRRAACRAARRSPAALPVSRSRRQRRRLVRGCRRRDRLLHVARPEPQRHAGRS